MILIETYDRQVVDQAIAHIEQTNDPMIPSGLLFKVISDAGISYSIAEWMLNHNMPVPDELEYGILKSKTDLVEKYMLLSKKHNRVPSPAFGKMLGNSKKGILFNELFNSKKEITQTSNNVPQISFSSLKIEVSPSEDIDIKECISETIRLAILTNSSITMKFNFYTTEIDKLSNVDKEYERFHKLVYQNRP